MESVCVTLRTSSKFDRRQMVGDSSFMFAPQNESVLSTGAFSQLLSVEAAVADFMVVYSSFWILYFQVLVSGALLKLPFHWFHTLKSFRG